MSHEIYYTSAPEGLKRGTSGFCTVAASENIPKALWDRLETLSAYRHQFSGGTHANPVSFAHWILNITGKTHHVLSRICDSGVDHTQRTNAFAHHLVLDTAEIEGAAGGPAWLLEQPGVMAEHWDGKSGSLTRGGLPRGDRFAGSKICRAWEEATGDAGWGGHLADLFAKSPTRPVCLLFSPGQEMMPLIAESIGLLPPAARWNVTFNTYFTSMPTSATCLWRCCLAGTQAAQTGLRYAAGGLVLDLTDRARLPALPGGTYVTAARTGQAAETPRAAASFAQPTLAELKKTTKPPAPKMPEIDPEDEEDDRRRESIFEFAPVAEAPESSPSPLPADELTFDFRDPEAAENQSPINRADASPGRGRTPKGAAPGRIFRNAEEALEQAEQHAIRAAQRRRKQVMLLFIGAMAAIAVGTGLVVLAMRNSGPKEIPEGKITRPNPTFTGPSFVTPETTPLIPQTTITPRETQPVIATSTQQEIPTPDISPTPAVVTYPDSLTFSAALERPNLGTGIGDRTQSLALRAGDFDPARIAGLRLAFFAGQPSAPASNQSVYKIDTLGTITAQSEMRNGKPGISLHWKASGESGTGAEAAFIVLDSTRPAVDFQWHSAILLRNPGMFSFLYWTLQNSSLVLDSTRPVKQQILAKPFAPPPVNYGAADFTINWPIDLPKDVKASEPGVQELPSGWRAEWYPDWESKDPASRTADNALQVIKFRKATSAAAVDAWFLIVFHPGLSKVESTFTKRYKSDQDEQIQLEKKFSDLDKKITDMKNDPALATFGGTVDPKLIAERDATAALVAAYKEAMAGYNELNKFDIAFEFSDGMRLATLHFERTDKASPTTPSEAGK